MFKIKNKKNFLIFAFVALAIILGYRNSYAVIVWQFSDGNAYKEINFAAAGTDSSAKISIPINSTIDSVNIKLDQKLVSTKYIWIPLSGYGAGPDKLAQIDASDGSVIKLWNTGDNPSRLAISPDGNQVWVANRSEATVTKIDIVSNTSVNYSVPQNGPRGVTFDHNGNIWVADGSVAVKLDPNTGAQIKILDTADGYNGSGGYGADTDPMGYVWMVNRGNGHVFRINPDTYAINDINTGSTQLYGIGIDSTGDVWVAGAWNNKVFKIAGSSKPNFGQIEIISEPFSSSRAIPRGIAIDSKDNAWIASNIIKNVIYDYDGANWGTSFFGDENSFFSLAVFNGKLYAGSTPRGIIHVFDGSTWNIAYDTPETTVYSLAVFNGKLYAGTGPNGIIYAFDGTSWNQAYDSANSAIYSLAEFNSKLYAGATGGDILTTSDGTSWSKIYDTGVGEIRSLAVYSNKLYANQGGNTAGNGDIYVTSNGTSWSKTYDGSKKYVFSLAEYNGKLYAGTGGDSGDGDILAYNGAAWTISYNTPENNIYALWAHDGQLYAGSGAQGYIYKFNGTAWSNSYDTSSTEIRSFASFNGKLYAGSNVISANYSPSVVYKLDKNGGLINTVNSGKGGIGASISIEEKPAGIFTEYAWIVNYGDSSVIKIRASDGQIAGNYCVAATGTPPCPNVEPYNYSNMTGFRGPLTALDIGNNGTIEWSGASFVSSAFIDSDIAAMELTNLSKYCDCPGCQISDNTCTIDFTFKTTTPGTLWLNGLNINVPSWQGFIPPPPPEGVINPTGASNPLTLEQITSNLINYTLSLIVVLGILSIVASGTFFIVGGAASNYAMIKLATALFEYTIVGLSIAGISYAIISAIMKFFQ